MRRIIFVGAAAICIGSLLMHCGGGGSSGSGSTPSPSVAPPAPPSPPPPPPPQFPDVRVVFTSDKYVDEDYHVYSCKPDGTDLVDLCGAVVAGGDVYVFHISPDGLHVAFAGDRETNNKNEMYVVPIGGGTVVKVSGGNSAGWPFAWSSDSTRIAHGGTEAAGGPYELFVSNRDGGGTLKVSGPMTPGGDLAYDFAWAPDGSRIAYVADQDTDGVNELYTSLPDGTGNVKVCGPLTTGQEVRAENLEWSPDSSRLSYVADQDADDVFELYSVAPDGTGNVKVSGTLVSGGDVLYASSGEYLDRYWAPDGSRIAYVADQDADNVFELWTSLPDGGGNVKVSGALVAGGDVSADYAWCPDSSLIAFRADKETDETFELYAVPPDGGATVKLSGTQVAGGDVGISAGWRSYEWAPDASRIVYSAGQREAGRPEAFITLKNGTGNVLASGDNPPFTAAAGHFIWAPDSSRLLFRGLPGNLRWGLYSCLANGSGMVAISGDMPAGGGHDPNVTYLWASDSSCAFYGARQESPDHIELFCTFADGQGNIKISGTLVAGGHVGYSVEIR